MKNDESKNSQKIVDFIHIFYSKNREKALKN